MKKLLSFILVFYVGINNLFATAQRPDKLFYEGKKHWLYSNPLEQYFDSLGSRPQLFIEDKCWGTNCWRGYIASWEIKDNLLYLKQIESCCYKYYVINDKAIEKLKNKLPDNFYPVLDSLKNKRFDSFKKLKKAMRKFLKRRKIAKYSKFLKEATLKETEKSDLKKLFGNRYKEGVVQATWFTGTLRIPDGKQLEYVHMGYGSIYERDIIFYIKEGKIINKMIIDNTDNSELAKVNSIMYDLYLPKNFLDTEQKQFIHMSDTLSVTSSDSSQSIYFVASFNKKRISENIREKYLTGQMDSLKTTLSPDLIFTETKFEKFITSTAIYTDVEIAKKHHIRVAVLSNINSKIILLFEDKVNDRKTFMEKSKEFIKNIKMKEFGY